jgi:putative ABC transport system permease protein
MRGIRLLIKNAFKSAFRNIYQIIGLSMLILLVALIASLLVSTTNAVIDANDRLQTQSNLRDAVVSIDSSKIQIDSSLAPIPKIYGWKIKTIKANATVKSVTSSLKTAIAKAVPGIVDPSTDPENADYTIKFGELGEYGKIDETTPLPEGTIITVSAKPTSKLIAGEFSQVVGEIVAANSTPISAAQEVYQDELIRQVLDNTFGNGKYQLSRSEGRTFSEIKNGKTELSIKPIAKFSDAKNLNQVTTTVDKLVITDGKNISTDKALAMHQTVIQKTFAEKNNVKIGDIIRFVPDSAPNGDQLVVTRNKEIQDKIKRELKGKSWSEAYDKTEYANMNWFEVVGYGISADFAAPILDQTTVLPNIYKNLITYVDPEIFGFSSTSSDKGTQLNYLPSTATLTLVSNYDREVYFSLKLPSGTNQEVIDSLNNKVKDAFGTKTDIKLVYSNDDSKYQYYERTHMFKSVSSAFMIVSEILLIIIATIAGVTIMIMTRKYVEQMQKQIGCLKALGYKKREVVNNFVALPLIASIIGCVIGYTVSLGVGQGVLLGFKGYFNVDFGGISFDFLSFIVAIVGMFLIMLIISYIAAYWVIRRGPLDLLRGDAESNSSSFARGLKKLTISKSFDGRLRGALVAASAGKIVGMTGVILLSTILMSATAMAPKIMKDNESKSFDGLNYVSSVEYTQPVWNNPTSFFRTFNQNYDDKYAEKAGWGVKDEKINNFMADLGKSNADPISDESAISLLPYKKDENGNNAVDVDKVLNSLFDENISSNYYAYEITQGHADSGLDGATWGKMAYLGWRTLPMKYLKSLNLANFNPTGLASTVVSTLAKQWGDYGTTEATLKAYTPISSDTITEEQASESIDETYDYMLWMYKKYASGLPLTYTKDFSLNDDQTIDDEQSTVLEKSGLFGKTVTATDELKKYFDSYKPTSDGTSGMFKIGGREYDFSKGLFAGLNAYTPLTTSDQKREAIVAIARWFNGIFYKKMGSILLETSYSRAPYFVQQKMKAAYISGSNYALAFNINPYDPQYDDLGTMLNAQYFDLKGKAQDFKIYGVSENQRTVELNYQSLKDNESEDYTPIILNQTAKIKGGFKKGDVVDMNYVMSELADRDNNSAYLDGFDSDEYKNKDLITDIDISGYQSLSPSSTGVYNGNGKYYVPDSAISYYAKDSTYPSGSTGGIKPAKVAGQDIGATGASSSTNAIDSLIAATNGDIKINEINKKQKFKIVGFQDSFGTAQGWITNNDANHLLKYDLTRKYIFQHIFIPQFLNLFNKGIDSGETTFLSKSFDLSPYASTEGYDKLVEAAIKDSDAAKIKILFNNMFPIYNYKNSLENKLGDLDVSVNTDQRFGDYSSMGLNGGVTDSKVYTGFGEGATKLIYPVLTARQILEQITAIVDMVIILFILIAFIVSLTMIILTTSLIIKENITFIATMKILGYSDPYIVRQILGMYITGIIIAFIAGFLISWFGIVGLGQALAIHSTWVLPIVFYWWYPFAVIGLLSAVYVASSAIGYASIKKVNPLVALQYEK